MCSAGSPRAIGLPAIPLYLLAGLVVGDGGFYSLDASLDFIETGADIGVVLLLFMLGLEYTTDELMVGLRSHRRAGMVDAAANFAPGFAIGLLLGWEPLAAALLGGVTYVSSSGIIARLLDEFERLGNRETPVVLSVLVIEDLAMAVYLPIVAGLLIGDGPGATVVSIVIALAVVAVVLFASARFGGHVSRLVNSESAELVLLTVLGLTLLVAGLAEEAEISSAVGAFLVGVSLSGRVAEQSRQVLAPVRDLFAGIFFVWFGLEVDPERPRPGGRGGDRPRCGHRGDEVLHRMVGGPAGGDRAAWPHPGRDGAPAAGRVLDRDRRARRRCRPDRRHRPGDRVLRPDPRRRRLDHRPLRGRDRRRGPAPPRPRPRPA